MPLRPLARAQLRLKTLTQAQPFSTIAAFHCSPVPSGPPLGCGTTWVWHISSCEPDEYKFTSKPNTWLKITARASRRFLVQPEEIADFPRAVPFQVKR